jgi:hypothetical protein
MPVLVQWLANAKRPFNKQREMNERKAAKMNERKGYSLGGQK